MRGTKAKALRREAYGDKSQRAERQYVGGKIGRAARGYRTKTIENAPGCPRAIYQALKKGRG